MMTHNPKWRIRRAIALACFMQALLMIPELALFEYLIGQGFITSIQGIAISVITFCTGVVIAYFGFATHHDIKDREET